MAKIYKSSYIPPYVPPNLKWYERDGLMTYIDRLNYERVEKDRDSYVKNAQIINFDIINNQIKGEPLQKTIREYKTVTEENLKKTPKKDKKEALGACFRTSRKDLYVNRDLAEEYFKTW